MLHHQFHLTAAQSWQYFHQILTSLLPVRRIPTREIGAFVQTIFHKTDYLHMPHGVFSCHTRNDDLFATFPIAQLFISFSIPLRRFLLEKEGKTVAWWRRFFFERNGEKLLSTLRRHDQHYKKNDANVEDKQLLSKLLRGFLRQLKRKKQKIIQWINLQH